MTRPFFSPVKTTLFVLTSLALTGCGVRGAPAVPPPMWGDPAPEAAGATTEEDQVDAKPSVSEQD